MMRRLVMRHSGELPLVTIEHIWREIITTFTAMQAPFGVVTGPAEDALAMRDLARFYFGFSVPVTVADSNAQAIAEAGESRQQVALIAADEECGRWWSALADPLAPKVFAKLPFIDLPGRPASLRAYVVGPPLEEILQPDITLLSRADAPGLGAAVAAYDGAIVRTENGEALVELPSTVSLDDVARELGSPLAACRRVGGFFQPIRRLAERAA
jgi:hypothetical protein